MEAPRNTEIETLFVPSTPLAMYRARGGGQPAGLGDAPLVLGHALGSSKDMWNQVLDRLPSDLTVILWEQPGHGGSELLGEESPDALDTAEAIAVGLNSLGVGGVHIAGLSLGGMTTLAFAQRYPDRVWSFAVLDSGPALPPAQMWLDRAAQVEENGVVPLVDGTMERWFTSGFAEGAGAEAVARIREIFLATNPLGYAQCCRILANTDLSPNLGTASSPALVLTGALDLGTPPEQARDLAAALPGASEAAIVDDARHLTAVEQPDVVADALVSMIATAGTR